MMFRKIAIAAALSQLLVVSAFAQTTRAEVKAEAASANKSGTVAKGESPAATTGKSTKARAAVKKEAAAANKSGDVTKGESPAATTGKSTASRAEVKAEAASANKSGKVGKGETTK